MSNPHVYLIKYRRLATQRAHFAVYVPDDGFPGAGTLVHVVGAPMAGFQLEIKKPYNLAITTQAYTSRELGQVPASSVRNIEQLASTVRPPGISQNFMGPVDGVSQSIDPA
jgi:hypothetical protein